MPGLEYKGIRIGVLRFKVRGFGPIWFPQGYAYVCMYYCFVSMDLFPTVSSINGLSARPLGLWSNLFSNPLSLPAPPF